MTLGGCGDDSEPEGPPIEVTVAGKLPEPITISWKGDASSLEVFDCYPDPCQVTCDGGRAAPSTGQSHMPWAVRLEWGDFQEKLTSPMTYGVLAGAPDPSALPLVAGRTYGVDVTDYGPCSESAPDGCGHADAVGCALFTP